MAGIAIMIVHIPLQAFVANKQKIFQVNQMKLKDLRIKSMSEILNGMKVLKLYAWEESFEDQVLDVRRREGNELKKIAYLNALTSFFFNCTPFVVSFLYFLYV